MQGLLELAAITVELRRNTSKPGFETWPRGQNIGTNPTSIPSLSQGGQINRPRWPAGGRDRLGQTGTTLEHRARSR
jgi:hypothetical protein